MLPAMTFQKTPANQEPMKVPTRSSRRSQPAAPPAASELVIEVVDRQRTLRLPRGWLAGVVRRALARQGVDRAELCVLLVDDRRIATLHARWLSIPGPTDVLTFGPAAAGPKARGPAAAGLRGDIVASAETARRVAREVGWQPRHELAYYVIHGLLHLAGYDDHSPADRRAMRARERVLLAAAGLPPAPRRRGSRA
jgi:probable rRNA maturation factor